ncbi:MAG: ferredoxin--NADP reductase, partial [Burkholderiaceae bacterium]|nr:ferredoxin--NADP reductase [Burkholderiaceae bacterium]
AYADQIRAYCTHAKLAAEGATLQYVPVVTRGAAHQALSARIPALLQSGALESHVGLPLDPEHSRVMICGNPEMIAATRPLLAARGFATSRRGKPGQMAVENYW